MLCTCVSGTHLITNCHLIVQLQSLIFYLGATACKEGNLRWSYIFGGNQ